MSFISAQVSTPFWAASGKKITDAAGVVGQDCRLSSLYPKDPCDVLSQWHRPKKGLSCMVVTEPGLQLLVGRIKTGEFNKISRRGSDV